MSHAEKCPVCREGKPWCDGNLCFDCVSEGWTAGCDGPVRCLGSPAHLVGDTFHVGTGGIPDCGFHETHDLSELL